MKETRKSTPGIPLGAWPNGAVLVDSVGVIVAANRAAEDVFGYVGGSLVGLSIEALVPARLRDLHRAHRMGLAVSFQPRPMGAGRTFEGVRRDGSTIPIEVGLSRVENRGGDLVLATVTDMTERRRAEEALRASDERFRELAENIREVFWLTDPAKGAMIYVSPAYESIWGRTCESLYASPRDWIEAIHPEDRERVTRAATTRQTTGTYDEEYRIVRPDGAVRWVRDRAFPVRATSGEVVRVAGVAEDVTERQELEAQLRQTQKMESVGMLAGGVAHDFNNWLTVIAGNCELLLTTLPEDDPSREMIDEIRLVGERAASLTRQLLAFSRQQVIEPRALDLGAVVADTEKMLRRLLGEDVILTATVSPGLSRVMADPGLLVQVLMNLAVNARDAMPRGGRMFIEVRDVELDASHARHRPAATPGRYVMLAVGDTGCGMTASIRARAFEPFFTTKGVGKGTGMGLAVVHGIVAQSGGYIDLESEAGVGTTFRVYLPAIDHAPSPTGEGRAAGALGGTETVLLVEDEDIVRRVVHRGLRAHGYTVLQASGADDALRLLDAHGGPVDLLVTDVVMPGTDGRELAEALRALRPGVRVLYTSGYTDDAVTRHGVEHAEVAFLQKPYTPIALLRKVREVLDK